jgi:3-oxoacyl-[acyl-carrier protein] reductase
MPHIILTGASRGIGRAVALELARDPQNKLLLLARDRQSLFELSDEIKKLGNSQSDFLAIDLQSFDYEEIEKWAKAQSEITTLILNAGYLVNKPFEELSEADWRKSWEVNLLAPVMLVRLLLPFMGLSQRAHILTIGSMGGFQGSSKFAGLSAYSHSKAALANLTECLAEELKNRSISVNCLALGSVQTQMFAEAFPSFRAAVGEAEIAPYIAHFALHAQALMNGKIIPLALTTP